MPEDEKKLYGKSNSNITDMAKRREVKIAQFKKEKEIKNKIAVSRIPLYIILFVEHIVRHLGLDEVFPNLI